MIGNWIGAPIGGVLSAEDEVVATPTYGGWATAPAQFARGSDTEWVRQDHGRAELLDMLKRAFGLLEDPAPEDIAGMLAQLRDEEDIMILLMAA